MIHTKYDIHVHCSLHRKKMAGGNPNKPEKNYLAEPEEIINTFQAHSIEKAIVMSYGEHGPEETGTYNDECRKIAEKYPFFSWMCNFDDIDPDSIEERMAKYQKQGAVGVGELMINQWMDSPVISAIFAAAEKLQMPVTFHMSTEPGYNYGICDHAGLPLLEEQLRKHPDAVIVGHSQPFWLEISGDCPKQGKLERNGFGKGPVTPGGTLERLLREYPNLYCDLSAYSGYCAISRDPAYGVFFLNQFHDRLMYATDATNQYNITPLAALLDQWAEEGKITEEAYEDICRNNAQRLYWR